MFDSNYQIDWSEVWKSLDWDDPERRAAAVTQRLHERAAQYATVAADTAEEDVEEGRAVLTFGLGDECYGVDVMTVRDVRSITRITRVPGSPPFYQGVTNVRGQIITVLDLRRFFDLTFTEQTPPNELVVAEAAGLQIGMLAHDIQDVLVIPEADIQSRSEMYHALGVTADRLVLLDIEQLFNDKRLIVGG